MRFEFLGTGTSAGVPAIGCRCRVCTSADPRDRRLRCSAALTVRDGSGQERVLLIDAGPDLRQQALRAGLVRLDAILLTHHHVDHTWGLDEVRRFNAVMGSAIDVYGDGRTLAFLRRVYGHIFDASRNENESFVASLVPHELRGGEAVDLFGVRVTPVPLVHGRVPVLGFRFDAEGTGGEGGGGLLPLAYCTDVSGIPPGSWGLLRGVRTLVLGALRYRHHPTHFTIDRAVEVARRIKAERTWLIHMAHDVLHAEADLPDGIALAWDGLVLNGDGSPGSMFGQ